MVECNENSVSVREVFLALADELRSQAEMAHQIDELLAGSVSMENAPPELQKVDRIQQSLDALSVLTTNAAHALGPETDCAVRVVDLTRDVRLEAIRALFDKTSGANPDAPEGVSLFC